MARGGVPKAMAEMMAASGLAAMTPLILLLTTLILLGCLMNSLSVILLAISLCWPVLIEINGGDWVAATDSPLA
jgi:TRAP-type C4-dicarboxylate transport system permease large subunit